MKILFIAPAPRAGTLQYTHNLANALGDRGHEVALATGLGFELKGFPRRYQAMEVFDRFRPRLVRLFRFLRFVLSFRPQIVHLQGAQHPALYLAFWCGLRAVSGARFVYSPHDVLPNKLRGYHLRALALLYRKMQHVFLSARSNLSDVVDRLGADPRALTVLPIADLTAFVREELASVPPSIPAERKAILCFGLIEPRKGIGTLIRAFPQILERVPQAHLSIVGKPLMDIAPYLKEIRRLGIQDRVDFRPEYVSFAEMKGLFQRAEVVVLPYESGWNSGVIASAFGFERPVIATTVGGFEEVVERGVNGLLVPPRDESSLAAAVAQVLNDEALRARLRRGARKSSEQHSWAEIAQRVESVYRDVIGVPK